LTTLTVPFGLPDSALPFLVSTVALSVVITWMFMGTHGSVLPIILLDGALNTWPGMFLAHGGHPALALVQLAPTVLLATIVVLRYGPTRLAKRSA
jgi:membrane protease YdiL (CAAX protease family)